MQFVDYYLPIYCLNDKQVNVLIDTTPAYSNVATASCITNSTMQSISYKLIGNSGINIPTLFCDKLDPDNFT